MCAKEGLERIIRGEEDGAVRNHAHDVGVVAAKHANHALFRVYAAERAPHAHTFAVLTEDLDALKGRHRRLGDGASAAAGQQLFDCVLDRRGCRRRWRRRRCFTAAHG